MNKTTKQTTAEQQNYPNWELSRGIRAYEIEHDRDRYYILYKALVALEEHIRDTVLPEVNDYIQRGPAKQWSGHTEIEELEKLYIPLTKAVGLFCERLDKYTDKLM